MKRIDVARASLAEVVQDVRAVVSRGGCVILPTDTVYGVFCDPRDARAVERIYLLKRRPSNKALSLHFGDVESLLPVVSGNELAALAVRFFLPGALTLVVPRPASVADFVTAGLATVGLRLPDHPVARAVFRSFGALAGTSANFSGEPAFTGGAPAALPDADLLVDAGPTPYASESTIVDFTGAQPRLLRQGVISVEHLERHLGPVLPVRPNGGDGA